MDFPFLYSQAAPIAVPLAHIRMMRATYQRKHFVLCLVLAIGETAYEVPADPFPDSTKSTDLPVLIADCWRMLRAACEHGEGDINLTDIVNRVCQNNNITGVTTYGDNENV